MSYCRWDGTSDVYVIGTIYGTYECIGCASFDTLIQLKKHLRKHVRDGDRVPDRIFARIESELKK